jgi:amino acid adenylation domain-containing protein
MASAVELDSRNGEAIVAGQRAHNAGTSVGDALSPGPRAGRGPAPLSFSQERLWYLDQIYPGEPSSHLSRGLKITGELNHDLLRQSLDTVVSRQESLRATFATSQLYAGVDGKPSQLISQDAKVELVIMNLSTMTPDQRMEKVRAIARSDAQRGFDLTIGPLLRATLLVLGTNENVLLVTVHRIISDYQSLDLLLQELWQAYKALWSQASLSWPALPLQFADYAEWQRRALSDESLSVASDYWRTNLKGAAAVLELPADRPRPAVQNWRGESLALALDHELSAALPALAHAQHTTLFVILLAAFQVLLARYSRQTDVVVGSEFTNREFAEVRDLIGPLSNTFALRSNLSGNPAFHELLAQVHENVEHARRHKLMPFEKLVEELELERSLSFAPVFQVAFILREPSAVFDPGAGLQVEEFEFETGVSRFDLSLEVRLAPNHSGETGTLKLGFEYDSDLFDRETVARLAAHFEVLLRSVVANPNDSISALHLLTAPELNQILHEWNTSETTEQSALCIQEMLAVVEERNPLATAVVCAEERLTYSELNQRANQLAHHLQKLGIGPDRLVGVCLERSLNNIVALLAVLKSGGAYVPIDPAYPHDRVTYMLDDSDVAVLITQQSLVGKLPAQQAAVVLIDTEWEQIARESSANPLSLATPGNLAYVIYTSGSTGRPKGVAIEHRAVVAFLEWALSVFSADELSSVLLSTSFCFDLSVFELFTPLCAGGTVVLAANALQLPELDSAKVTLVNTVPSAMTELVRMRGIPDSVRTINLAGEPLPQSLVNDIYARSNVRQVFNLYGPSEDTTYSTFVRVEPSAAHEPSIGRPIANSTAYILDAHLRPVPAGVPGELHLAGGGLARGYLNRPELTAEKFIPNPFSRQAGARMYRTGDLARYSRDGQIEFLGRLDNQVKLRGFRIELGEIETTLRQQPAVEQAIVTVREDQPGDKRLVAYLVANDGADSALLETSTMRRQLSESLPDYMIPSAFVWLDEFPLTPNGKIDRRALPRPEMDRSDLKTSFVAPRDNLEQQLTNILEKILDVKTIGVRDSFFDLGGHSLLAVRLFAQIENRFGKRLPLVTLFQAPTIEQLAQVLRETDTAKSWSSLVAIQPLGSQPPLFCVHAAGANVLIYRPLSRHLGTEQPVYALQARGLDGEQQPFRSVEEMAAHYLREIRAFQPKGPYHLLGASFGGLVIFEMALQLQALGEQVGLLAMLNTNCPVYPRSKKVGLHLAHLKEHGPVFYSRAIWQTVRRKLGRPTVSLEVTAAPDPALARLVAERRNGDEALVRTVVAIMDAEKDYVPRGRIYPGRITLFLAQDEEPHYEDNRLGWEKLAREGLEVHEVPGTHVSIREEPHVAVLAEKLKRCLET